MRKIKAKKENNLKRFLNGRGKERYYFWDVNETTLPRQMGLDEGYDSLQELLEDQQFSIKRAEQGGAFAVIFEAKPILIIKENEKIDLKEKPR